MKHLIILFVLYFNYIANAQDLINPPKLQVVDTCSIVIKESNQFIKSWNWGSSGQKLDSAMLMNSYHSFPYNSTNTKYDVLSMQMPGAWNANIIAGRNKNNFFLGQALHLEPTLKIDSTLNFKPRFGDNNGSVFGFYNRNFTIGDTINSGLDFDRYKLKPAGVTTPVRVLDNAWDGDILRYLDYAKTNDVVINSTNDSIVFHPFNGKQYYLSTNLRALNITSLESHLNDTLLSIRVKYWLYNKSTKTTTTSYVRFDSIPQNNSDSLYEIRSKVNNHFRGFARKLTFSPSQPDTIFITGRMLKMSGIGQDTNNITISAFASFDGVPAELGGYENNPHFKFDWYEDNYNLPVYITKVDVEVNYHGKDSIAIDWIRLETPRAQKIMRGEYDDTLSKAINFTIGRFHNNNRDPKIHRFYAADELTPQQWLVNRYYNMLCDTIASTETFSDHHDNQMVANHYLHATAFKEFWNGSNMEYKQVVASPILEFGSAHSVESNRYNVQNYIRGYRGTLNMSTSTFLHYSDSLTSEYETKFHGNAADPAYASLFVKYPEVWEERDQNIYIYSSLMAQEYLAYVNYFKQRYLLYNPKPFWSNLWVQVDGIVRSPNDEYYVISDGDRPKTGEEIRTQTNLPLILGTKGFVYWFKSKDSSSTTNYASSNNVWLGLQNSTEISFQNSLPVGTNLIYSEVIGGDYININDNSNATYNWQSHYDNSKYNWSQMGVPEDSLYIGLRSTRAELFKLHSFIDANENQLMNLDLQAWYGKGFTKLYSQHADITNDTILKDFVKIDSIRSRKIFQPLPAGNYNNNPPYESLDSAFFDITLLKDKNKGMDTVFFIGIMNRRTDPLVWLDVAEPTNIWNLEFFPSARFDEGVRSSGADSTFWRELWWKRLGAREITIPLNYSFSSENNETIFKVTELGAQDTNFMKNWWMDRNYHHTIDTSMTKNGNIVMKLLPGEGKILKVEVSRKPQPFMGDLTYSNQRKLIAYPLIDTVNSVFKWGNPKSVMTSVDTVVYHLTYQRNDSIFYMQSFPMHKDFPTEHIDWKFPPTHISKSLAIKNTVGIPFDNDTNGTTNIRKCKNPTIVVRKDSLETNLIDQTKAYICYTCEAHFATHGYWRPVIVENIIQTGNDSLINLGANVPRLLSTVLSDPNSTVTINASYNGNFYAWSDSLNGIVAAWKNPHAVRFENPALHKITIKGETFSSKFRHPSLNTYSRVQLEECNSALVWQEYNNIDTTTYNTNIYYTRLQLNNIGQLYHYVNQTKCDTFPNYNFRYNTANNCLVLNFAVEKQNQLPMVYRGVENNVNYFIPNYDSYDPHRALKHDRIYWQGLNWNSIDKVIYYAGVDNFDTRNTGNRFIYDPGCMRNMGPSLFRRRFFTLKEPNIAQGEMYGYYDGLGNKQYININVPSGVVDKNLVLNFTELDETEGTSGIWHVPHGYFTLINQWSILTNNFTNSSLPRKTHINYGKLPHLAALPFMNDDKTMRLGRRVYQGGEEDTELINSSVEYFFKGDKETEPKKLQLFGYEDGENITYVSPVMIKGFIPTMSNLSVFEYNEDNYSMVLKDTIKTDWITINDVEDLEFMSGEINNKTMNMFIEVEGLDTLFNLNILKSNEPKLNKMTIINGNNQKIRFLWTKKHKTSRYQEQIEITDKAFETYYKSSQNQIRSIFDLGNMVQKTSTNTTIPLKLYPNPVIDELYVTLNIKDNIGKVFNYKILNVLGEVVKTSTITNNVIESVNTQGLTNGTYYIIITDSENETFTQVIEKFIINK